MKSKSGILLQFVRCRCGMIIMCTAFKQKDGDLLEHKDCKYRDGKEK